MQCRKAFIITEGGQDIGFGHITRCASLYEALKRKKINPTLIINDSRAKELLKGKNYRIFNWLKERDKLFKIITNAEIVIIDSYLANIAFYDKVSRLVSIPVYIDDTKRLDYPKGVVVNGSVYAEEINYPKKENITYLLGARYIPLRKEFWAVPDKKIKKSIKNILITFGGNDARNITTKILDFLNREYPDLIKNVIIGRGFKNVEAIRKLKTEKTNFIFYPDVRIMKNLMVGSDVAISGGGQTLYELARVGVPTIAVAVSENQLGNVKGLQKAGFIKNIGWWKNKALLNRLYKGIEELTPYEEMAKRCEIGKKLVDGKGAERIVSAIVKVHFQKKIKNEGISLRQARIDDCYYLWNWRNHPEIRKWCFNTDKIEYAKHKEWFARKIKEKGTKIYITENNKGEKIGQIRFELDKKHTAFVNVNLNPDFFGKGFGSKLIKKGTALFSKENPHLKEAVAEIRDENIASKRAFQKAGYRFLDTTLKDGKQITIFKFTRE